MKDDEFVPVTCRCKQCKRLFIEWYLRSDTIGKTKHWNPMISCNHCFVLRAPPEHRAQITGTLDRRHLEMLKRFPHPDLTFLDIVHAEMLTKRPEIYIAGISADRD